MNLIRSFSNFIVFSEDSILDALAKITSNKCRIVFAISESGILQGAMSDGDFRRYIAGCNEIDLNVPVAEAMNLNCCSAADGTSTGELSVKFSNQITAIPLLDSNGRIVAVALPGSGELQLGTRTIGDKSPCFLIAEIGNNHNGKLDLALQLIDASATAGADCAKFQMRDMEQIYMNQTTSNSIDADLGTQYTLDLLERFQLSDEDLFRCFDYTVVRGLVPLCTAWDERSLDKLDRWGMPGYKIASADFTNHTFLSSVAATRKPILASTGMANEQEIRAGIRHLQAEAATFVLLHCNSTYPTPYKDVNLRYLARLRDLASAPVGYSGHERGIEVPLAAVSMGAVVVEKHITLNRGMEGNDHKVSLLPDEFASMVQGIRRVEEAMGSDNERSMSQGEAMNREILAKSLVANCLIPAGTPIEAGMVRIQSPGQGLQPYCLNDLIGRTLFVPKTEGEPFFPSDLERPRARAKNYCFQQPFGVPVRYHDINAYTCSSNLDLVEIHLSYKDLDVDLDRVITDAEGVGLVVHAPELFAGDHTLDLCSVDEDYRQRSISELKRVIRIAAQLRRRFTCDEPVLLVTNVGGFSQHRHLSKKEREPLRERLIQSLAALVAESDEVELIPQTMPPFPWHFGGQSFHNLFVDPEFIQSFCQEQGIRVCLDVSHSQLACNHLHKSLHDLLTKILPYSAHLHLADASGVSGEGLQIGEGCVDWVQVFSLIAKYAPSISFIPEIWQGHKNSGEGAWLALERLESASRNSLLSCGDSIISSVS